MDGLVIINDAKVDETLVLNIYHQAGLKSAKIILRLMDGFLPENASANILPKSIRGYAKDFRIFDRFLNLDWDIGIAISCNYCLNYNTFPAYFAYLLGHELGHATLCANDLDLHVFCCLIQEHIKIASQGEISSWHELPHEIKFDQFGLFVAEKIFGRKKIENEIKSFLKDSSREDLARLEVMLTLHGTKDLSGLRNDLIVFAKPYQDRLIESWEESIHVLGKESLASYFDDFEALFE